jgi:hypothetical protein
MVAGLEALRNHGRANNSPATRGHTLPPPKLSPEEERELREMVTWHSQKGLHFAKQTLERANSNQQREAALKEIQIFTEMLERNKEK